MMRQLSAALVFSACQNGVDSREICSQAHAYGVVARAGSRIDAARLEPGTVLACETDAVVYRQAVSALDRLPSRLRPPRLSLEIEPRFAAGAPPLRGVEVHRPSAALLSTRELAAAPLTPATLGVWLHEVAHVRAHGARPASGVPVRLFLAVEEGAADYFAAVTSGSTLLGDESGEIRDVAAPPALGAAHWASLAFADAFDAHHFGWALAGELFRQEPSAGPLLDDLLSALSTREAWPAGAGGSPGAALDELMRRCPTRSQSALESVLARWVPRELRQG